VGKENVEKEQAGFVAEAEAEAEDLIYISQRGGGVVKSQVEVNRRRGLTCFLLVAHVPGPDWLLAPTTCPWGALGRAGGQEQIHCTSLSS